MCSGSGREGCSCGPGGAKAKGDRGKEKENKDKVKGKSMGFVGSSMGVKAILLVLNGNPKKTGINTQRNKTKNKGNGSLKVVNG